MSQVPGGKRHNEQQSKDLASVGLEAALGREQVYIATNLSHPCTAVHCCALPCTAVDSRAAALCRPGSFACGSFGGLQQATKAGHESRPRKQATRAAPHRDIEIREGVEGAKGVEAAAC